MTATELPPATTIAKPTNRPPGDQFRPDQWTTASECAYVGANHLAVDHIHSEAHSPGVGGNHLAGDHVPVDARDGYVSGNDRGGDQLACDIHPMHVPATALLALAAASLDDIERTRIATGNRLRAMRDDHGLGETIEYRRAELIHDALKATEHQAILDLQRALRKHPLGAWIKRTVGIGEKQGARLLAALDDPYWNHAENRPRRGPAELWAYCGLKPGQRRQRGVKANWNAAAKMRARLCAESCIKHAHSPYRADYDRERAKWAERDTTDMHKHNHALHVVAKAILRDLYLAAKDAA